MAVWVTDLPDWQKGVSLFSGDVAAMMADDFPDWTDGVNVVTTPPSPPGDYPDWTKNVSQVSGLFPPAPIPSPYAWWDAAALSGIADGSKLASWTDMTGRARNLVQPASGAQPTYYNATAAKLVNGRPAVWFDNATTWMSVPVTLPQPFTVCVALIWPDPVGHVPVIFANGDTNPYVVPEANHILNISAGNAIALGLMPVDEAASLVICFNGPSSYCLTDSTLNTAASDPGSNGMTIFELGAIIGQQWWNGPICEVLIYPRALSGSEATTIYNYFKPKWGTS